MRLHNSFLNLLWNSNIKKILLLVIAALAIGLSGGCNGTQKKQAQDLVKAGSTTSERLAKYYDTLRQQRADHMSLEIFRLKRADSELNAATKKQYEEQLEALAARVEMARKLKGVYDSLGKLIDYDAPGEVTGAVVELKKAIEDVSKKKIPGFAGVDSEAILKKAVNAFVSWQQIRQFRKNAPKAQVILDGIVDLFDNEKIIYTQISKDYYELAHQTAKYLHGRKQLSATSIFQKPAETYGLQVLPTLPPETDADSRSYITAMEAFINNRLDAKLEEFTKSAEKEPDGILATLKQLKKIHEDFMLRRKPEKEEAKASLFMYQLPDIKHMQIAT